jgi:hypothetical protein
MPLRDSFRRPVLTIKLPLCLPSQQLSSTLSDSVDAPSVVNANLDPEPMLFPDGVALNLQSGGVDDPRWSRLLSGALEALYTLNIARDVAPGRRSSTSLQLLELSQSYATASVEIVSFRRHEQPSIRESRIILMLLISSAVQRYDSKPSQLHLLGLRHNRVSSLGLQEHSPNCRHAGEPLHTEARPIASIHCEGTFHPVRRR